jgi:hypothetical protein
MIATRQRTTDPERETASAPAALAEQTRSADEQAILQDPSFAPLSLGKGWSR